MWGCVCVFGLKGEDLCSGLKYPFASGNYSWRVRVPGNYSIRTRLFFCNSSGF